MRELNRCKGNIYDRSVLKFWRKSAVQWGLNEWARPSPPQLLRWLWAGCQRRTSLLCEPVPRVWWPRERSKGRRQVLFLGQGAFLGWPRKRRFPVFIHEFCYFESHVFTAVIKTGVCSWQVLGTPHPQKNRRCQFVPFHSGAPLFGPQPS